MPHISKSSLLSWGECRFAWYCNRVLGLPGKDSLGMILGGVYHETQKMFFDEKLKRKEITEQACRDFFEAVFKDRVASSCKQDVLTFDAGDDTKFRDDGLRLVEKYYPYAVTIEPIAVERQFELSIPGESDWTVYGFIDLIGVRDGRRVVIDHKTTKSSPYKRDDKDPSGTEDRRVNWVSEVLWSPEVACYVLAQRVLYGIEEDVFEYHWAIKTKKPEILITPVKIGDRQLSWFLDVALSTIRGIKQQQWDKNPSSSWCSPNGCAYWEVCHGIVEGPKVKGKIAIV